MKAVFWLLVVAVAAVEIGAMIYRLPPRKSDARLPLAAERPMPTYTGYVICPFGPPCWKNGVPTDAAGVPIPNYKHWDDN